MRSDWLNFFDPREDIAVVERRLPHWSQPGVITFITWRTDDSLPKQVADRLVIERNDWLRLHEINPMSNWRAKVAELPYEQRQEFRTKVDTRWHDELDNLHGECVLKRPQLATIVHDSLLKFDGDRYFVTDFVVMPNHIHLLASFPTEDACLEQCENWKHFTATRINRLLGQKGRFWQQDGLDHLVRSEQHFQSLRLYIANNPIKAGLRASDFVQFSKKL
jgi:type I restriction enzyme R subunit